MKERVQEQPTLSDEVEPPSLLSIDQDTLVLILTELDGNSALNTLSTCRTMSTHDESLWRSLSCRSWPQMEWSELPHELWRTSYCRRVHIGMDAFRHLDAAAEAIARLAACEKGTASPWCKALERALFAIACHPAYEPMRGTPDAQAWAKRVGRTLCAFSA